MQPAPAPAPADPSPAPAEPPQPAPVAVVEPVEPQPAPQPAEPSQDAAYWKARYDTIAGKYNAEVPRLHDTLRQTEVQLAELRGRVSAQPPAPATPPPAPLVTEGDETKFGSDLIDMARRVAREEMRAVAAAMAQLEQLVRGLVPQVQKVQQVEQQVQGTREEQFYGQLAIAVPDWETVNKDPKWLAWLSEYDPVAGRTRQQSLDEAAKSFDSRRAAALFKLFKGVQPAPTPSPAPVNPELARQVAPSRSSTTTPAPQAKKQWSAAEYTYWVDPRRVHDTENGKLQEMIAEMDRAIAEGRVQFV